MALKWHLIEFTRRQHPGMWHMAVGSWHRIRQVAAYCNVAGGSGMTCHWICPKVRHIGILLQVSFLAISPQLTCHSAPVCDILSKSDHPWQKKMTSCRFSRWRISAILDFSGPIMGYLKSPCTTSYRSSIETMALNCIVFEKITFLYFDDRQTNRWTDPLHEAALNLINLFKFWLLWSVTFTLMSSSSCGHKSVFHCVI